MKVQSVIINGEEHEFGQGYTAGYNIEISDDNVISTLRQPDHYLGHWNAIQGQSPDFLETAPYDYNAGDYYIVNKTADMSWTNRVEMLGGEYHIPSLDEINKITGNETVAEVIHSISNTNVGRYDLFIFVPSNPEAINMSSFLWASNGAYDTRESDSSPHYGINVIPNNQMTMFTNDFIGQVLAFKDEPAVPDNTWTDLGDDLYYKASLGLYSFQVGEDEWITFKDKVEGASTPGGKGNLYQRGNCNPINVNEYEINTEEIDYSEIQPSTYSSNKVTGDADLFVNADDAWGAETQTAAAMRGPCPEGYIVPAGGTQNNLLYMVATYFINGGSAADIQGDTNDKIMALENLFLTQSVNNHSTVGSILQYKFESVEPTGEGWNLVSPDNFPQIYHNESLGLITINFSNQYMTFKDKLLGATEMFDPIGDLLQKGSITLNKAKLGNQYNWGNNYVFDLFGNESIEYIIDPDADIVSELQSKVPYGYNGSIVSFAPSGSSGGGGGGEMMYTSTKAASLKISGEPVGFGASIFSANPNLWDYVEVQHNLRPVGTEYVEDPSTDSEIENERVDINDIYLYDGTQWLLIGNHVVPHVFVTQKEYDAISDKKYSNGTLYLFVDAHPGEDNCAGMYEYDYFDNLWDEGDGGKKVSSIHPSDYSYCKDYIVAELNSKPMCYYNKFREENKLVAGSIPKPSPKSGDTKAAVFIDVRFLGTEEGGGDTRLAYIDYVETHDDACSCDECTYRFYTIDGSQWFEYNSYCGGGASMQ